jgi:hypothetical protein
VQNPQLSLEAPSRSAGAARVRAKSVKRKKMSLEALTAALPSFLNSNPKVDAATTDDDHPTPGHLYLEIAGNDFQ